MFMECIEAIKGRRSVRRFKDTAVGNELIDELLSAAQMAPSQATCRRGILS